MTKIEAIIRTNIN